MTKSKIYLPLKKRHTQELIQDIQQRMAAVNAINMGTTKVYHIPCFFEYLTVLAEVHNLSKT